jgi:hypothetical protein
MIRIVVSETSDAVIRRRIAPPRLTSSCDGPRLRTSKNIIGFT